MRRFTRLTNAFSKKVENHEAAVALHFIHYNLCRIHQTLGVTPAMEAGLSDHVWTLEEIVGLSAGNRADLAGRTERRKSINSLALRVFLNPAPEIQQGAIGDASMVSVSGQA